MPLPHIKQLRAPTEPLHIVFLSLINVYFVVLCNANAAGDISENIQNNVNQSLSSSYNAIDQRIWSQFLEDYVLSQSNSKRSSKDLPYHNDIVHHPRMGSRPNNYQTSAQRFANNIYIRRIGEAVEMEPHLHLSKTTVDSTASTPQFRPMTNQMLHQQRQQPGFLQQLFGFGGSSNVVPVPQQPNLRPIPLQQQQPSPLLQHQQQHTQTTTFRAVSENDLYLLGAIEKLVYRVDYLESRIKRSEQLIYYLMAGNNQKDVRDPCPSNFTRINENCYYINSHQQVNWKTANSACKAMNSHLAEFEKNSENEQIIAFLLNQQQHRGRDYWLGGLNPGLLWIWSNSAKPVNPKMNLTSIAMSQKGENTTATNLVVDSTEQIVDDTSVLNNTVNIEGEGRCLRLSYNSVKHSYAYYGQECTSRHYFICEYEDKTLDNKIKKITRKLKLPD